MAATTLPASGQSSCSMLALQDVLLSPALCRPHAAMPPRPALGAVRGTISSDLKPTAQVQNAKTASICYSRCGSPTGLPPNMRSLYPGQYCCTSYSQHVVICISSSSRMQSAALRPLLHRMQRRSRRLQVIDAPLLNCLSCRAHRVLMVRWHTTEGKFAGDGAARPSNLCRRLQLGCIVGFALAQASQRLGSLRRCRWNRCST